MKTNHARLQMFRGKLSGHGCIIRPPWAIDEDQFNQRCNRCDRCIEQCPQQIIKRGLGGFPEVNFQHGACDFCGNCATACAQKALLYSDANEPWKNKVTINMERCLPAQGVMCFTCGEQCEQGAICFKPTLGGLSPPQFNPDSCNGCGACIAPCPAQAIMGYSEPYQ